MRPPRTLPRILTFIALAVASPVFAQVKTGTVEIVPGGQGQTGSSLGGGVAPLTLGPAALNPSLGGSPGLGVLSAPALSLQQGLTPSALTPALTPAAVKPDAQGQSKKPVAAAQALSPDLPPGPSGGAAVSAPPGAPPFFVASLLKLGVPSELAGRLQAFLATRHPGDQDKVYHGLGHSHEVADLTARVVLAQDMPAEKKILLILSASLHDVDPERAANTPARVSATLAHIDGDAEAAALVADFGGRYGFDAAQVKALIMATDFAMDPVQMKEKQDAFAVAAKKAFPSEPAWALDWGRRLAFADQSSTYVGSLEQARARVAGLAVEIRAQLEAIGKGPGPSDEVMLAGSAKFLSVLKQNPLFSMLPAEQAKNFDAVYSYFEERQTPEAWTSEKSPVPARAPPESADLVSARRYIKDIMQKRVPTEREIDSLLGDWLKEAGIREGSPRHLAVRAALVPQKTSDDAVTASRLDPRIRHRAALLIRLAAEHGTTAEKLEAMLKRRGLFDDATTLRSDLLEQQIAIGLHSEELRAAVVGYPDTDAGELMRAVSQAMRARGGKSVEEIARDGVFVYADLASAKLARMSVSRDPDGKQQAVVYYVTRDEGRWVIDVYRQNRQTGLGDASLVAKLKAYLVDGGVPEADLR